MKHIQSTASGPQARSGFTLIELTVVIFIIGLISAIAFPYLIPIIVFSELEGSARRLSGYGRATVAEAAFQRTDITVRFDMDQQEWHAIRWVLPSDKAAEAEKAEAAASGGLPDEDQWEKLNALRSSGDALSGRNLQEALERGEQSVYPEGFDQQLADQQMQDRVYRYARTLTENRAKNVKHESGFLDEIGPLFEEEFTLDESNQPVEEELTDSMLRRSRLPEGVRVETIEVDGEAHRKGVVEFQVDMLGFAQEVVFYLVNEDSDYFTVIWNPVTGNTGVVQGNRKPA